jgi:hypothetical protein
LLKPDEIRRLHSLFAPLNRVSSEWCEEFCRIAELYDLSVVDILGYLHRMWLYNGPEGLRNLDIDRSLARGSTSPQQMRLGVTLAVRATNCEKRLRAVIDFYREDGLCPIVIVDRRAPEAVREMLFESATEYIQLYEDDGGEDAVLAEIASRIGTPWVLLLEDDELPTPGLLDFVDEALLYPDPLVWGFPRARLRYDEATGDLQYSQFVLFEPGAKGNVDWRLFTTAGLLARDQRRIAHRHAVILDFAWICRSLSERIARAQDEPLHHAFLCETIPEAWHMFASLPDEPCRLFAKRIRAQKWAAVPALSESG